MDKRTSQDCSVMKIDFETFIHDYRVHELNTFNEYLNKIWEDLSLRNKDPYEGISKSTFAQVKLGG